MTTAPVHTPQTSSASVLVSRVAQPERALSRPPGRAVTALAAATALLSLVAAGAGLLVDGAYAGDVATAAMLRGYDLVTLAVAMPLLVLGLRAARHGGLGGLAVTASLLAYTAYTYAYYAFGTGFNDLFLLHVAVLAVSSAGLLLCLVGADVGRFRRAGHDHVPSRTSAALLGLLSLSLGGMWTYHAVANAVTGEVPVGSSLVETDLLVHLGMALDLVVLVPLYGVAAVLVWRRTGWGYLLAALAAVAGVLHQVSYVVALPVQVAADVPGAVGFDPVEPVIVAVYVTLVVLVLGGLIRGDRRASRPGG